MMANLTNRMVMCVGTWPEDNYTDFEIFMVRVGESDAEAFERAKATYGSHNRFYIREPGDGA